MKDALSIIADEHRSLAAELKGLQAHVAEARAGRVSADFHLAGAMLDYIQAFPERLHHPKEDEYLFRFLRLRSAEAASVLHELEAQHTGGRSCWPICAGALSNRRPRGMSAPSRRRSTPTSSSSGITRE